jgi:hypothetical protein
MSYQKHQKRFIAQFNAAEWSRLSQHRVFLHFLKIDLKVAASIAAEALQRPVLYLFPASKRLPMGCSRQAPLRLPNLRRHRRFRL